jgi:hypothetical protein
LIILWLIKATIGVIQTIVFTLRGSYDEKYIFLCLYVDDMLVAGPNMDHIKELKQKLAHSFAMKDLGVEK